MEIDVSHVMKVAARPKICFSHGQGSWLIDTQGRRYLDFVQGWAVNCLGHSPQVIQQALLEQSGRLINPGPGFYNQPAATLAKSLATMSGLDEVFFTNSGAEANEGAIKLARKWGQLHRQGAYKIITFENGFHGRTLATMSASGKPAFDQLYEPKVPGFIRVPYNNLQAVSEAIDDQTVAVMLELIQGEAGVVPADPKFIAGLRALTQQRGLLLIVDEVQTGIGRCGSMLATEYYQLEADILALGKGLGGGVPIAAMLAKASLCCFEPGDQGGTFNGNALVTAVASAVLDTVDQDDFLRQLNRSADMLRDGLAALSDKHQLGEVRGAGLLLAIGLNNDAANKVAAACEKKGLLINAPRADCLRLMPALNVTAVEIDQALTILDQVLGELT